MSDIVVHYKTVVPLFGIVVTEPLCVNLSSAEFFARKTLHMFDNPVRVFPRPQNTATPQETEHPLPLPRTGITMLPWNPGNPNYSKAISDAIAVSELPSDFATFDGLGAIALRSGAGGLGGFQTQTVMPTKQDAKTLLVLQFEQEWPTGAEAMAQSPINPYEPELIDSLLDGLRLSKGIEPAVCKAFHWLNGQITTGITKWPLFEIPTDPVLLVEEDLHNVKKAFLAMWQMRLGSREKTGCRIIALVLESFFLSSVISMTSSAFLHLMIAFEALFKARDERVAKPASRRLATVLADSKKAYDRLVKFMYNVNGNPGCCQIRNQIAHGSTSKLTHAIYAEAQRLICAAILRVADLLLDRHVDIDDYYRTLEIYCASRLKSLPES